MSSLFSAQKDQVSRSLERVQDLQASFFRRINADSPRPPGGKSLTGGEPPTDNSSIVGSTVGPSFVCIMNVSRVCGGIIGTGGKFCIKDVDDCQTAKHSRELFLEIEAGFYLKGPAQDACCCPIVPIKKLGLGARESLLQETFEDITLARQRLDVINSLVGVCDTAADLRDQVDTKPLPRFGTPLKKPPRSLGLRAKFDVLNVVNEIDGPPENQKDSEKLQKFTDLINEIASTVEENRSDLDLLTDQMCEYSSQIGVAPKRGPPNLWVGHLEVKDDMSQLQDNLKRKVEESTSKNAMGMQAKLDQVEHECKRLRTEVQLSFNDVAQELSLTNRKLPEGHQTPQLPPDALNTLNDLQRRLGQLEEFTRTLSNDDKPGRMAVRIGKYRFESIEDVGSWADKHLPSSYPFGPFIDAYSFLERVKSARDVGELASAISDMDTRRKSSLTADEAIVVEAFQHPLPRGFRNSTSNNPTNSWLPGMKKKESWENKSSTRGFKIAIQDNTAGIRSRIEAIVMQRLGQHPVAEQLARELLSDTVTFLTSLSSFISNTFLHLTEAGYPEEEAWNLVSKLVYRMFATDCYHDKRGIATEMLDSDDHRSMAISILWATFATHQVMREYMKYTFSDHPSISGECTRFLVANAGISKLNKAMLAICKMENLIEVLERKADLAEKKATTAANRADEAMKAVKKKAAA